MRPLRFEVTVSVNVQTGEIRAAYIRVREGAVADTREIKDGFAYADYDADGLLLGVELLGPCEVSVLDDVGVNEPEAVRRFLRGGVPREMVPA
jgi:hypothetical protein